MVTHVRRLIVKNRYFLVPFLHCLSYRISYVLNPTPNGTFSQFNHTGSIDVKSYFIVIVHFLNLIANLLNFKQLNMVNNLRCSNGIKMLNKFLLEFYWLLVNFHRNLCLQMIKILSIYVINNGTHFLISIHLQYFLNYFLLLWIIMAP